MTRILIRHADILTLDAADRVLRDADLAIEGEHIVAVGAAPSDFVPDEVVQAAGQIAMPGLYNAHTHSAMTLWRGWAEGLPLERWLAERIWPAERQLSAADVYWGAALAAVEMIRSGVVGFADHYFYMDQVAAVVAESGLRANLAWCAFGGPGGEVGADLAGIAAFVERWNGAAEGRVRTLLGPHSPLHSPAQFLARTAAVAARLGVGIHIHLAETPAEVAHCRAEYDLSPVKLLERNGIFDVPVLAAHGAILSAEEIELLSAHDVTIVYCPSARLKLGLAPTPHAALQAAGVHLALGGDSPAISHSLAVLPEARLAALLAAPAWPAGAALRLATQAGAQALGFDLGGRLAPGHLADLVLLDRAGLSLTPAHDLAAGVLYGAGRSHITDVMVAGRWLMRRRALQTLDEARILAEAARRARALTERRE